MFSRLKELALLVLGLTIWLVGEVVALALLGRIAIVVGRPGDDRQWRSGSG